MYYIATFLLVTFFYAQNFCMQLPQVPNTYPRVNLAEDLVRSIERFFSANYINPLVTPEIFDRAFGVLNPSLGQAFAATYRPLFATNVVSFRRLEHVQAENATVDSNQQAKPIIKPLITSDGNISISFDRGFVASKTADSRMIRVRNMITNRIVVYEFETAIKAITFGNASYCLAIVLENEVILWYLDENRMCNYILNQPSMLAFTPDDSQLAVIYENSKIFCINRSGPTLQLSINGEEPILAVAYKKHKLQINAPPLLACLKPNGLLAVVDIENDKTIFENKLDINSLRVRAADLYANTEGDLFLRDIIGNCYRGSIEDLKVLLAPLPAAISSLFLNITHSFILTGARQIDGKTETMVLRILEFPSQMVIGELPVAEGVCNAKISNDGTLIAYITPKGELKFVPEDEIKLVFASYYCNHWMNNLPEQQ